MTQRKLLCILSCVLSLAAAGCFKTNSPSGGLKTRDDSDGGKHEPDGGAGRAGSKAMATAGRGGDKTPRAGTGSTPVHPVDPMDSPSDDGQTPSEPARGVCVGGGLCIEVFGRPKRAADLLFIVDNSGSMRQEQAALREQFPKLIVTLTQGRMSDGTFFPPLTDLHLGVVSTDMGLAGRPNNFPGCNTQRHVNGGDDGVLQHPGNTGPGCAASYPPFLAYDQGVSSPETIAQDFACISSLGTSGCGFEQQLEAGLKALWPKTYIDADGFAYPPEKNPILFLSTTAEGRYGHGDVPTTQGGNAGFMRRDALLGIILVTDEEDCSSKSTEHFISTNDPANPLSKQGINVRCYYNKQNLFEVERYLKGYPGLKPGHPEDVLFAAIVGVPRELVSAEARATVNFSNKAERDAYYDMILNDPQMQERPMNEDVPAIAVITPSCTRTDSNGERADAYPPRRIVEVAKGIGENAIVQSICQDDFGPAMDGIIALTSTLAQVECLPRELRRGSDGKVACDLIWEFPAGVSADCGSYPYLSDVSQPRTKTTAAGGLHCKVEQLSVTRIGEIPQGEGFYYDDFTADRELACRKGGSGPVRIAYTQHLSVPEGVRAFLDCAD
jgi:hypothetical protein